MDGIGAYRFNRQNHLIAFVMLLVTFINQFSSTFAIACFRVEDALFGFSMYG